MVYNETGLEGFNMSFEMLSDLGIKKYEMCRDDIGLFRSGKRRRRQAGLL